LIVASFNIVMSTYDKNYQDLDYFGKPYLALVAFFKEYMPRGRVLDLGCGRGRDSIALARLGYDVLGVDISSVGVSQMMEIGLKESLSLVGEVADIYDFHLDDTVDIVLLDSMLHSYKRDKDIETQFVQRLMGEMKVGARAQDKNYVSESALRF
jgi:SAM-dependent methyltransferase